MIKLSACVSKKLPVPDVEFSSRSYSAGMEVEVASGASSEEIQQNLRALYELLEESIEEQVRSGQAKSRPDRNGVPQKRNPQSRRGPAGDGARRATQAQLKAIWAIGRERGYTEEDIERLASESFGAQTPAALSIGEASRLIDALKDNGKE